MATTYTKLRSGNWGIRGTGSAPSAGATVTVTKKSGESRSETVERVVWSGNGVWIASVATSSAPRQAQRSYGRRYGSGAGSASPVPGYSSYCTDNDYCRCYDCAG